MILRKVVGENGKIVYEPITFEEALKISKAELVFTDEDEEERYDDFSDESDEEPKSNNKNIERIMRGLPFLDDEDLKEMVDDIIKDSSSYQNLPLMNLMPFLSEEDADRLFLKTVDDKTLGDRLDVLSLARVHYVSEACLDQFVDEYINGKHQHVDVDAMYPFLSSKSIKKLFKYHLNKKDNK
jgi:hypothetical protein